MIPSILFRRRRRQAAARRLAMLRHPSNHPANPAYQRHLTMVHNTDRSLNR